MNAETLAALAKIERVAEMLQELPTVAANAYANGAHGAAPIVDRHFTAGNQERYGWSPLSKAYAREKAGQTKSLKAGAKALGRVVSRGNLPILVASGKLRAAVTARTHQIIREGDVAKVIFAELPAYALYHQDGAGHLPKRSPFEPNAEDIDRTAAAVQRYIDAQLGTGGPVAVSADTVPGRARTTG